LIGEGIIAISGEEIVCEGETAGDKTVREGGERFGVRLK